MVVVKSFREILMKLRAAGYEAYLVGGCVRDILLNRDVNDYDITTSARPDEVLEVFKDYRTFELGKKFGTISVLAGEQFEITTYRMETDYTDFRHPDKVIFSNSLSEDLKRRDFTINAMAMGCEIDEIIDLHGGREDLKNKIIKTVGNPDLRFREDALRMLRAIRFATSLDFEIEKNTLLSIEKNKELIKNVSKERNRSEFEKILLSKRASKGIELLFKTKIFFCMFDDSSDFEVDFCVLENTDENLKQRLAVFVDKIVDIDEKRKFLQALNYSKKFTEDVILISGEKADFKKDSDMRLQIFKIGVENARDVYAIENAKRICRKQEILDKKRLERLFSELEYGGDFLKIGGDEIKSLGYEGRQIGEILKYLKECVLVNPSLNERETLLKILKDRG